MHPSESVQTAVGALFKLEHARSPDELRHLIRALGEMLQDSALSELRRSFTIRIKSLLRRKISVAREEEINSVTDLMEANTMLAETIEGWFEEKWKQGMQQGVQQGMQRGEGAMLHRLLTRRFGSLSCAIESRLAHASTEQLEIWGDRVLDAKTLDDVFLEH